MALTRESLLGFMKSELGVKVSKINDQTLIFTNGIIDSHMLLQLITFIEGEAKIKISTGDLSLENFDSVERILAFVKSRTG